MSIKFGVKVLVIYEIVPEHIHFYELEFEPRSADLKKLREAHGLLANAVGETEEDGTLAEWVSEYLLEKPKIDVKERQSFGSYDDVIYTVFLL